MRHRRERPVFETVTSYLGLNVEDEPTNDVVNRAVGAGHEAGHSHRADKYGPVGEIYLFGGGAGEMEHSLAPAALGPDEPRTRIENCLVCLAGPCAETLTSQDQCSLFGEGSASDFQTVWRTLAKDFPNEADRLRRINDMFWSEVRPDLYAKWWEVCNLAGYVLRQTPNRDGDRYLPLGVARRVLSGEEPNMSHVFFAALRGFEVE